MVNHVNYMCFPTDASIVDTALKYADELVKTRVHRTRRSLDLAEGEPPDDRESGKGPLMFLETLVVVDHHMMRSHGSNNITMYVLTVLNMVSVYPHCTQYGKSTPLLYSIW